MHESYIAMVIDKVKLDEGAVEKVAESTQDSRILSNICFGQRLVIW